METNTAEIKLISVRMCRGRIIKWCCLKFARKASLDLLEWTVQRLGHMAGDQSDIKSKMAIVH